MTKRVLVPVDGSGYASKAIDFAADLAKIDDVIIHLLHVVRQIHIPEQIREYVRAEKIEEPPAEARIAKVNCNLIWGWE